MSNQIKNQQSVIQNSNLKLLTQSWFNRAGVRKEFHQLYDKDVFEPLIPDYPISILPFSEHPDFLKLSDEKKSELLSWAWIAYNKRVILAEERIANPAFIMLSNGVFPGTEDINIKIVLQQCLIDEHFHTLMHLFAIENTYQLRKIKDNIQIPDSLILKRLLVIQDASSEIWQKNLLALLWLVISELSINTYLDLLSEDDSIQANHRDIIRIHNRDEYSHRKIIIEIMKSVYPALDKKEKQFFTKYIPEAISAFIGHDYSIWEVILQIIGIKNHRDILQDCMKNNKNTLLKIDFSYVKNLLGELEIDFEQFE